MKEHREVSLGLAYTSVAPLTDASKELTTHMAVMPYLFSESKFNFAILAFCGKLMLSYFFWCSHLRLVTFSFRCFITLARLLLKIVTEVLHTGRTIVENDFGRWCCQVLVWYKIAAYHSGHMSL